jgi:tetratricopeptide (TPR) repeat protein
MKHRHSPMVVLFAIIVVAFTTMGFQCSSPNVTSGKLYYQQYQSSKNEEKLDQALAAFQKEVTEKPNSAEGWYWLGIVQGEKKQYMALQQSWQKARQYGKTTDIDQNSYYFWGQAFNHGANSLKRAQIRKDEKLYLEAADAFKAATLIEPDSSARYNAFVYQAFALMGGGKADDAFAPLNEQIKRNPNAEAYSALAQLHTLKGNELKNAGNAEGAKAKYNEVITLLNDAVVKFPESSELNNELLNAYIATDRVTEAVTKFKDYADKNATDGSAQYAAGTAMLQISRYEDATVYLGRAIQLDGKNTSALYNMVVAYLRWGISIRDANQSTDIETASDEYKEVIRKGVPHLQQLLTLQPEVAANWDLAGRVYASIGMTKEAAEAYEKADALRKE